MKIQVQNIQTLHDGIHIKLNITDNNFCYYSESQSTADKLNNTNLIIVFFITVINAFIGGFGVKDTDVRVLGTVGSILSV